MSWGSSNDVAESLMMKSEVELSTLPLFNEGLFIVVAGLAAPSPSLALLVGLFVRDDLTAALLMFLVAGLLFDIIRLAGLITSY